MREIFQRSRVNVSRLAELLNVSRQTIYNHLSKYDSSDTDKIPNNLVKFFRFMEIESNQTRDIAELYMLTSLDDTTISKKDGESDELETLIEQFCELQATSNFMPVVLPTGTGKTHSIVNYIAKYIADGGEKKIFFITTLKKNLPVNEDPAEDQLLKSFIRNGIGDRFEDLVIQIGPISKTVIKNRVKLTEYDKIQIKSKVDAKICDKIFSHFQAVDDLNVTDEDSPAYKTLEENFGYIEKKFRHAIRHVLKNEFDQLKLRKTAVITDPDWRWVSKLYPSVSTDEKQVYLMSMNKFIVTHDPIISKTYEFYDSSMIKDSLIFIDEFDVTKTTILNSIAEDDSARIDCVGMFKRIYRTLEKRDDIRRSFFKASEKYIEKRSENGLIETADTIYFNAKEILDTFHLECDFKIKGDYERHFLFRDYRTVTVGTVRDFKIDFDKNERINYVIFRHEESIKSDTTLNKLFSALYRFFRSFQGFIRVMAESHMENEHTSGHDISFESAVRTMLDPYDFDKDQNEYLVATIMFDRRSSFSKDEHLDLSIYETGFSFYDFEDDEDHNLTSKLYFTSFSRTPEKMLLKILSRTDTKIIAISATAMLPSVVGNYDFRYLREQKDIFREYMIPEKNLESLDALFNRTIDKYYKTNINIGIINDEDLGDCIEDLENKAEVETFLLNISEDYVRKRYIRIFKVYKEFICHEEIRSMLCFVNIFPMAREEFNSRALHRIFSMIQSEYEHSSNKGWVTPSYLKEQPFETMKSLDFDETKENLLKRLGEGEKIFIITTYATVGAGQNLQYKVPQDLRDKVVRINSLEYREKESMKDFDAIYLDMPTNIIPQAQKGKRDSLVKSIFAAEFLMEGHELDVDSSENMIRSAFNRYAGIYTTTPSMKEKDSFRMYYARTIIQAIGRICRTPLKNPQIYIYSDAHIAQIFTDRELKDYGRNFSHEFTKLFEELQKIPVLFRNAPNNLVDNESFKTQSYINGVTRFAKWTENSMKNWSALRESVLKHPTTAIGSGIIGSYDMYTTLDAPGNTLRYDVEGDYRKVYIHIDGKRSVSETDARLNELLKPDFVRTFFEDKGYSTSFVPNEKIMCPVLYHNIYKGALGEAAGQAVFNHWKFKLSPIDDPKEFEKFDFVADNGTYVDFKNWGGNVSDSDIIEETFEKLRKVDGKTALIINVLKPKDRSVASSNPVNERDGLKVILIPFLYDSEGINTDAHEAVNRWVND